MTKAIVVVLILGACLCMALTIGDGDYHATILGWMPFLTAIMLIGLARGYVALARRSLGYADTARFVHCERGERLPFSIVFENGGPLILLNVQVELYVADMQGGVAQSTVTSLTLGPRSSVETPFAIPFEHVGMFAAGLRSVTITDFLGLFSHRTDCAETSLICVTPKVAHLGSFAFSEDSERESFKTLKTALADSLDYAYVRDYEPGDPLKTIHWKLSARSDHYLTRLFEKSTSPGVVVLLDFYAPGIDIDESMDLRDIVIESALSVADLARAKGFDTQIRYTNCFGEKRTLTSWDADAVVSLVREMPQSAVDDGLRRHAIDHVRSIAGDAQAPNNVIVCSANVDESMVASVISAKQMRKSPFLVAAVPHRLVDRDLERHVAQLGALDAHRVGYRTVASSGELEGRDLR